MSDTETYDKRDRHQDRQRHWLYRLHSQCTRIIHMSPHITPPYLHVSTMLHQHAHKWLTLLCSTVHYSKVKSASWGTATRVFRHDTCMRLHTCSRPTVNKDHMTQGIAPAVIEASLSEDPASTQIRCWWQTQCHLDTAQCRDSHGHGMHHLSQRRWRCCVGGALLSGLQGGVRWVPDRNI